jgi:hypothetical protein
MLTKNSLSSLFYSPKGNVTATRSAKKIASIFDIVLQCQPEKMKALRRRVTIQKPKKKTIWRRYERMSAKLALAWQRWE